MVRKDGKYSFYKIQHQWDKNKEWVFSSYGEYAETNSKPKKGSCLRDTFSACGWCWQQTGEHGVYDIRNARTGLKNATKAVAKDFKAGKLPRNLPLRIVLVEIEQKTIPIK